MARYIATVDHSAFVFLSILMLSCGACSRSAHVDRHRESLTRELQAFTAATSTAVSADAVTAPISEDQLLSYAKLVCKHGD